MDKDNYIIENDAGKKIVGHSKLNYAFFWGHGEYEWRLVIYW